MIKLVVFDLDDTLYDEMDYIISGYKFIAKYLESKYNISDAFSTFIEAFQNGNRHRVFNYILEKFEVQYDDRIIKTLVNKYRNHYPDIKSSRKIINILELIKIKHKLAIISDGYLDAQKLKITALDIKNYFDKIYLTDELGQKYWKPSLYYFEKCQQNFNLQSNQIVYIGDNWKKDFYPGNTLGWKTIGILSNTQIHNDIDVAKEYKPQIIINDLNEIINHIN